MTTTKSTERLAGLNAVITGASQGLGLEIARAFLEAGAAGLALCARNENKLAAVIKELKTLARPGQHVLGFPADVSRAEEVDSFIAAVIGEFQEIHILVNNAGIYGPKGPFEETGWAQWQEAFNINFMGSLLMCRALLPHFKKARRGKIIQISGGGATNPMPFLSAYAASKAAVVRFIETLALETAAYGLEANCIAPGLLDTRLLEEVLEAGPDQVGQEFYDRMLAAKTSGQTTPLALGASLAVFLASPASRGISGKLISAQWDNWAAWPGHLEELKNSDVYTLRRLTGRERDFTWGDK